MNTNNPGKASPFENWVRARKDIEPNKLANDLIVTIHLVWNMLVWPKGSSGSTHMWSPLSLSTIIPYSVISDIIEQ